MADGATTGHGGAARALRRARRARRPPGARCGEQGRGRLVLVAGEAGIGKTALVRAFCDASAPGAGSCGARATRCSPRARSARSSTSPSEVGRRARRASWPRARPPARCRGALARELRGGRPTSSCSRTCTGPTRPRSTSCACSPAASSRSRRSCSPPTATTSSTARHPLRIVLGELPQRPGGAAGAGAAVGRRAWPSSPARRGRRAELHRRTAGNPFFVTEVLAAGRREIPETVRDAVLARAARLDDAARGRCSTPSRSCRCAPSCGCSRRWRRRARRPRRVPGLGHAAGRARRGELPPRDRAGGRRGGARARTARLALHRRALARARASAAARPDPARLAHHAEAADDAEAVLRYAPAAGERAASSASHREAAAQFARALRYADGLPRRAPRRAARAPLVRVLPDRRHRRAPSTPAARALDEHRAAGDRRREGDAHRWLSRLAWFAGDNATAEDEARRAVELLEPLAPGRELAMAYSNMAQLRMLGQRPAGRERAGASGRSSSPSAWARPRSSSTRSTTWARPSSSRACRRAGPSSSAASRWRSKPASRSTSPARTPTSARAPWRCAPYALGDRHLDAGIAYCAEHDLDLVGRLHDRMAGALGARPGALGRRRGATATGVLAAPDSRRRRASPRSTVARAPARAPGRPRPVGAARRGARARARHGRGAAPRAGGRRPRRGALARRRERGDRGRDRRRRSPSSRRHRWAGGELYRLAPARGHRRRLRRDARRRAVPARAGRRLRAAAAERWTAIGCPYEAALALGHADDDAAQRRGLAELQRLGAHPAARRVARAPARARRCATSAGARGPRRARTPPG